MLIYVVDTNIFLEALINDINLDIEIALDVLSRENYEKFKNDL